MEAPHCICLQLTWLNFAVAREGLDRCQQGPVYIAETIWWQIPLGAKKWLRCDCASSTMPKWWRIHIERQRFLSGLGNSHCTTVIRSCSWIKACESRRLWARLRNSLALVFRWICMLHGVLSKRRDSKFPMHTFAWKGSLWWQVQKTQLVCTFSHKAYKAWPFETKSNSSLAEVALPSNLRTLAPGCSFNENLDRVILPNSLDSLKSGNCFNLGLQEVMLPSSLKTVTLGI